MNLGHEQVGMSGDLSSLARNMGKALIEEKH